MGGRYDRFSLGAFRPSIHPVVPKSVVTLGLIKFDLGPEFGTYLLGVDTGKIGRELADGKAKHLLLARFRGYYDDRNTPSGLVGIELLALGCPSKPQVFHDRLCGRVGLISVGKAKDGVAVEGDGSKLTHDEPPYEKCSIPFS
jgi:hypothetical protein